MLFVRLIKINTDFQRETVVKEIETNRKDCRIQTTCMYKKLKKSQKDFYRSSEEIRVFYKSEHLKTQPSKQESDEISTTRDRRSEVRYTNLFRRLVSSERRTHTLQQRIRENENFKRETEIKSY